MSRYSTILLCAFSTIFALPVFGQCNIGCDFIFNGSGGPYNLNGGKTLCIQSGTFTGSINFTGSGNTVCIASGATFNPNNLNNANGVTIQNYGTFIISQSFSFGAGTVIINHNIILQNANFNYNGPTQLINHANADWTINTNFVLQNGSSLTNDGVILANAEFTSNAGTTVINNNRIRIAKNFNPSGVFNNYGFLSATGFININSNSFVRNYCSLFSAEGFNNNSGNTQNYGLIWVTNNNALVQINAPYYQGSGALTRGELFINNSNITGSGNYYFTKNTRNQGPFGNDGNGINFFDVSGSPGKTFDVENVAPHSSVTRIPFNPADSSYVWPGCSSFFVVPVAMDSLITSTKNKKIKIPVNKVASDTVSGLDIPKTIINIDHPNQNIFVDTGRGTYTLLPSGEIEFTPDSAFVGISTLQFVAFNNMGFRSNIGIISILVEDPSILPVSLIFFKATTVNNYVKLNWATASEINNNYFEIERSPDGIFFTTIERIKGFGNSNQKIEYQTFDYNPINGLNYYRLKQVDLDGTEEYFNIVTVDLSLSESGRLKLYPNPASEILHLTSNQEIQEINIFDLTGKVIMSMYVKETNFSFPVIQYERGTYIIQVHFVNGNTETARLIIR